MTELLEEAPPVDERSVGMTETHHSTLFEPPSELRLGCRSKFGPVTVAWETYGELSPARDNAIFICHALTGDAHAAGWHANAKKPGWWDGFIGPGKGVDTNKYFVICANILGGCMGTTGPGSINPETGERFCRDFPVITVGDMVEVHAELVRSFGIERLLAVVGGSLGGMQVLEWAARFPDRLDAAVVLASAANMSAQGIAFNAVGRRAIVTDPQYNAGKYYGEAGPRYGLALARMVAHITYLSEASIERKFGRRLQDSEELAYSLLRETEFQVESYLHYQGKRFVERFDANSYLYLTKAMDYFNLADSYGSLANALGRTDAHFLVISYSSDWLFPSSQSREIVRALLERRRHVTFAEFDSPFGHDSFLIDVEGLEKMVVPFLHRTLETRRKKESGVSRQESGEKPSE
ncbi:MAG: homoserine O-acetyltransferase [Planctomycetaceae bacterium]|nr:homoserine O-acetyltransferase [Planctomycetaceae bacterium]